MTDLVPLLLSREVASLLRVSEATLSRWRDRSVGPVWLNLNGMPRYRAEDVRMWSEERILGERH